MNPVEPILNESMYFHYGLSVKSNPNVFDIIISHLKKQLCTYNKLTKIKMLFSF